jgi:hypothetical protein
MTFLMFKRSFIRAFFLLAVLAAGLLVFAASMASKTTDENMCSESKDQCDQPKTQGEFFILEALNHAVMTSAR